MNDEKIYFVRAVEIHGNVWDEKAVVRALRFAKRNGMNALVLHANDIVDEVVWPARYYGATGVGAFFYENYREIYDALYRRSARRRYMPIHRRDFLQWVIRAARREGLEVYLENKELWFPDELEEWFPGLRKNGRLCCAEPVWWDFIRTKYRELAADFPDLAGVITSPGSRESRLSITGNRCECEKCRSLTKADWYVRLIMSIYEPLREMCKTLVVRDFTFDRADLASLAFAMEQLPDDVVVSLKNTPHDFYPTFPHNPGIGRTGRRRTWIEFDAMGQYFGWGFGIAALVQDMRERLRYGLDHGAVGVLVRTDWEGLPGHSCFDTPNLVNLYAAAIFANDPEAGEDEVYRRWLAEENLVAREEDLETCAAWIGRLLGGTWDVVRRAIYANDCVFNDSSCFPVGLDHAFWLAEEKNSLKDWMPEKANALDVSDENLRLLLAEKEEAAARFRELERNLLEGNRGLTDAAYEDLKFRFQIFGLYVEGFRLVFETAVLAKAYMKGNLARDLVERLHETLDALLPYARKLEKLSDEQNLTFAVQAILNPERIYVIHKDVSKKIARA